MQVSLFMNEWTSISGIGLSSPNPAIGLQALPYLIY